MCTFPPTPDGSRTSLRTSQIVARRVTEGTTRAINTLLDAWGAEIRTERSCAVCMNLEMGRERERTEGQRSGFMWAVCCHYVHACRFIDNIIIHYSHELRKTVTGEDNRKAPKPWGVDGKRGVSCDHVYH